MSKIEITLTGGGGSGGSGFELWWETASDLEIVERQLASRLVIVPWIIFTDAYLRLYGHSFTLPLLAAALKSSRA